MAETLTPDICVIGGGPGGTAVALAAAAFGVPAVLVQHAGPDGYLASGALVAAAQRAAGVRSAEAFGVTGTGAVVDFARVQQHAREAVAAVAPDSSPERLAGLGVRVIQGQARFNDRRTLAVGDQYEIRARRFVIAPGSAPALPDIPGIDTAPALTPETILDLKELPQHLLIVGAGRSGLEMAQAFRRLGSAVTVLDAGEPLRRDDAEAAAIVLAQLERDGVVIRDGVKIARVAHAVGRVTVALEADGAEENLDGTHLMLAAGRRPVLDGLNLGAAQVRYDESGIAVGKNLKTSNKRIYAIGGVAAGHSAFVHAAEHHAGLVIRNALFRSPVKVDDSAVPRIVFTDPELAHVGLTEAQARTAHKSIRILRRPYHGNARAAAERVPHGHIKIVTDKKGMVLGVTIVGAQAGELIAPWCLALAQKLNVAAFAGINVPHRTLAEIGKRAAFDFLAPGLTRPWVRRIIAWLKIFG